jgi:subtilisin family serine protease
MSKTITCSILGIMFMLVFSPLTSSVFAQENLILLPGEKGKNNGPEFIPGRYIVVLEEGISPEEVIRDKGIVPDHVYSHALNGFAGSFSPKSFEKLKNDPRVDFIQQDQILHMYAQDIPTGIDRIDVDSNSIANIDNTDDRVDVDIAILDTGVSELSDLNVIKKVNCASGGPFNQNCKNGGSDGNGHGTHVAGTSAALDNSEGVVGVAPGAKIWSVKVLDNNGRGYYSWIIAGIDYVTANANKIEVANMSLGGSGSDDGNCGKTEGDAMHQAICASVDAGVVYVVAAGNSANDAKNHVPAAYDEVLTVSALADFDGQPGENGSPTCRADEDDTRANFSNFGQDVDVIAPGVCIESTWKDGSLKTISGTSMAAPHVTGAMALYLSENPKPTSTTDVENVMTSFLATYTIPHDDTNGYNTIGDPDGVNEPLLYVGDGTQNISPTPTKPDAPRNLQANPGDKQITLTWDVPFSNGGDVIFDYHVYDNLGNLIATVGTDLTYTDTGLTNDQEYSYKITAENINGESDYSNVDSAIPSEPNNDPISATFTYSGEGGKNSDKHLLVTIELLQGVSPLSGSNIVIILTDGNTSWDGEGTTGSDGSVTFSLKNASHACYATTVISIDGSQTSLSDISCTLWPLEQN